MKKITTIIYALALINFISFNANAQTYCTSKGINTTHGYIKKVLMKPSTALVATMEGMLISHR